MKPRMLLISFAALALAGCHHRHGGQMVSPEEAAAAADASQAAWISGDAAKMDALYDQGIVGFDPSFPDLVTSWDKWQSLDKQFAGAKFSAIAVKARKIQMLGPKGFVVSGQATLSGGGSKPTEFRFTDVYQRKDGKFLIVNEHVSYAPMPMKPPT